MKLIQIRSRRKSFFRFGYSFGPSPVIVAVGDDIGSDVLTDSGACLAISDSDFKRIQKEAKHENYPLVISDPDTVTKKLAESDSQLRAMEDHHTEMRLRIEEMEEKGRKAESDLALQLERLADAKRKQADAEAIVKDLTDSAQEKMKPDTQSTPAPKKAPKGKRK